MKPGLCSLTSACVRCWVGRVAGVEHSVVTVAVRAGECDLLSETITLSPPSELQPPEKGWQICNVSIYSTVFSLIISFYSLTFFRGEFFQVL